MTRNLKTIFPQSRQRLTKEEEEELKASKAAQKADVKREKDKLAEMEAQRAADEIRLKAELDEKRTKRETEEIRLKAEVAEKRAKQAQEKAAARQLKAVQTTAETSARKAARTARTQELRSRVALTRERLQLPPTVVEAARGAGAAVKGVGSAIKGVGSAAKTTGQFVQQRAPYVMSHLAPPLQGPFVLSGQPRVYSPSWQALEQAFGTGAFSHAQAVAAIMNTQNVSRDVAINKVNVLLSWNSITEYIPATVRQTVSIPQQFVRPQSGAAESENLNRFIFG
jgi:hypothetical protein